MLISNYTPICSHRVELIFEKLFMKIFRENKLKESWFPLDKIKFFCRD